MATPTAIRRLTQDFRRLQKDPVPYIEACPLESNILEWRYCVKGPEDTPYSGGYYHGKLIFPTDFPFKPPRITMITPSGRFQTNKRLCLSISDFHPDTWNPAWSVATILTGLLSFMVETAPTVGSMNSTVEEKKEFAIHSWQFNLRDSVFCRMFPNLTKEISEKIREKKRKDREEKEQKERLARLAAAIPRVEPNYWVSTGMSLLWNIAPFILFASFVYIVQLVVQSS